ncbi:MAG: hypothetical protein EPN17_17680 [Methylobacter sp.]|nr:MAG: hypothetical protein EPN17_17680 [Methylobacter sp.]
MQTYLPFIKAMLSEWYLFTLNNALYAAALAATVWLLTAILYNIKIAAIKRSKAVSDKASIETLNATQQQLQQSQEELAASVEQIEQAQRTAQDETQRTFALKQLIHKRNKQIAEIIQTLATSFDLGERPLSANEDVKADALWQQHDKVIMQLIERLRTEQQAKIALQQTCQAETAKLAEKEALLKTLQTTLDNHTHQLSKLEQALEEQKSILQHQDDAQQVISDTLKKYQPVVIQAAEPEQAIIKAIDTSWQQPIPLEESPTIEETPIVQPEQDSLVVQVEEPQFTEPQTMRRWPDEDPAAELLATDETAAPSDITAEPAAEEMPSVSPDLDQPPVNPAKGSFGKIKNLFGKTKQQPSVAVQINEEPQIMRRWPDEEPVAELLATVETAAPSGITAEPADEEMPSVSPDLDQPQVNPAAGSFGKIKNLFGKTKQQPVKTEPQWTVTTSDELEDQPLLPDTEQQFDDEIPEKIQNSPGKLKGFYKKLTSKNK